MAKKTKERKILKLVLLVLAIFVLLAIILANLPKAKKKTHTTNNIPKDQRLDDPNLLYYSSSSYGLCSSEKGSDGACSSGIYLYSSGKLIGETVWEEENKDNNSNSENEKQLSKDSLEKIIMQIKKSGIMAKNCPEELIMDASWSYQIKLDGAKKTFKNPPDECKAEFDKIDELINSLVKNVS